LVLLCAGRTQRAAVVRRAAADRAARRL